MQPPVCPVRSTTAVLPVNLASVARASHAYGLRVLHFYVLILPSFYIINLFLL
jgi:hypothetical protein